MTLRTSNTAFLQVLDPIAAENVGWELQVINPADMSTIWGVVPYWKEASFQKLLSDPGSGSFTLRADDPILTTPLPGGTSGTFLSYGPLIRVRREGVTRFEWFVEDVVKPRVVEDGGIPEYKISGRGTAGALDQGIVLPAGYPAITSTSRTFNQPLMRTWVTLFNEAKARGCFPYITLTFNATTDTTGLAWPDTTNMEVQAGDNLLDKLNEWVSAIGYTWVMLNGFKLAVYPSFGNMRANEVIFHDGGGLQQQNEMAIGRRDIANAVFSDVGDAAGIVVAIDTPSIALNGRREVWIDAGDTTDASASQAFVNANLKLLKDPDVQLTLAVDHTAPDREVFNDWDFGDTVGIENYEYGTLAPTIERQRIVGLTLAMDQDRNEKCELVLADKEEIRQPPVVAAKKAAAKQDSTKVKKKPTKKPSPKKVTKQVIKTTMLNELSDVEYTSPTAGDTLIWDNVDHRFETRQLVLDLLENVTAPSPLNNYILVYNTSLGQWVAQAIPAQALNGLSDVFEAGELDGDVLAWDATGNAYVPKPRAYTRVTTVINTGSLTDGSVENANQNMAAAWRMYSVTVDRACRVRLYTTSSKRSGDAGRAPGTDPTGDHGCMLDLVFTGAGTLTMSPLVDGFVPSGVAVPYAIQNNSGATSPVQVSMTWVRTE